MTKFFGTLKDEGDIAFRFGFEGCAGLGQFYSIIDKYDILYASTEPSNGKDGVLIIAQDKDATTNASGLYFVVKSGPVAEPSDFVFVPVSVSYLQEAAAIALSPDSFVDFVDSLDYQPDAPTFDQLISAELLSMLDSMGVEALMVVI